MTPLEVTHKQNQYSTLNRKPVSSIFKFFSIEYLIFTYKIFKFVRKYNLSYGY